MTADFFRRKRWIYTICSQLLAGVIVVCMCYAVMVHYAASIWVGKSFYFLVSTNSHIEASTHEIRVDGGAGYLFEYEGCEYAAWSVYFKETDGATVQAGIVEPTQLLKVNISHLYLKTRADKKRKNIIQGALNSFYGRIDVLSQGIARLEQGLTQDACARILNNLQKQFGYLHKTYQEQYSDFSEVCATMQTMLSETLGKTIYCKDLRYILCSACDAYIRLSGAFSL